MDDDDPNLDETVTPEVLAEEWFKDPLFDPTKPLFARRVRRIPMDLKVTLNGTTYTAPAPMMREFKQYIKFLRTAARKREEGQEAVEEEFAFIACLFQDKAVTPEALDSADFATGSSC